MIDCKHIVLIDPAADATTALAGRLCMQLFKAVNDRHGRQGGDAAFASVGRLLWTQARKTDIVGRWGGEEFVIALTSTDEAGGLIVAERIRATVERLRTDRAMYAAKSSGLNRVVVGARARPCADPLRAAESAA